MNIFRNNDQKKNLPSYKFKKKKEKKKEKKSAIVSNKKN